LFTLQAKIVGGATSHIGSVDTYKEALARAIEYATHWIATHENERGFMPMRMSWQGTNALLVSSEVAIPGRYRSSSEQVRSWLIVTIREKPEVDRWSTLADEKLPEQFLVDIPRVEE